VIGLGLDLANETTLYYVVLVALAAVMLFLNRAVGARYGRVLMGIRENETRMEAIGFATYRYKLAGFAIAGGLAGLAGALFANHNLFVSPAALHWTQSATLVVMVLLGGIGFRYGGLAGAVALLMLEELLAALTDYWHLPLGLILLAVVFFAPRGLSGLLHGVVPHDAAAGSRPHQAVRRARRNRRARPRHHDRRGPRNHRSNGAGKTTLISQLSGALTPDAGSIRLRDARSRASPRTIASAVALRVRSR